MATVCVKGLRYPAIHRTEGELAYVDEMGCCKRHV